MEPIHIPVLPDEILDFFKKHLDNNAPLVFLDGTAGEGGHSLRILQEFPNSKVVLLDRDETMLSRATERLSEFQDRIDPHCMNFSEVDPEFLNSIGESQGLDGILMDLGISTFHFEGSGRGFSFRNKEPLDMRLEKYSNFSAEDLINSYPEKDLARIFWEYGEERWSKKLASAIVEKRKNAPLAFTSDLASLVARVIPRKFWPPKRHPATRIFQAIRIEVNDELGHIQRGIESLLGALKPGGVIAVISFHSLEDRIVKNAFRDFASKNGFKLDYRKPFLPTEEEIKNNPASRSAKLRILVKRESDRYEKYGR